MMMEYKTVIRNRDTRKRILRLFNWVPDCIMLRLQYRIKMGFWPDFKHPKRFTEKIQLYKMNYRNPEMSRCVDKFEVRKYMENKGLGCFLNDLYAICDSVEEINFDILPNSFVIKSTTGGGGLDVIIVKDKSSADLKSIRQTVIGWDRHNKGAIRLGREWAYSGMEKSRILVEKYLEDNQSDNQFDSSGLSDYKFFCFNGIPQCVQVDTGRFSSHRQNFYNMSWQSLRVHCTYPEGEDQLPPKNLDEMIKLATLLSKDFPFVRVDLYNVFGRVVFGELTFYPSSGYGRFHPDDFDFSLGRFFTVYK